MGELTKVTVNFIEKAYAAVVHAAAVTGMNKTNTINRAAQLYDLIVTRIDQGDRLAFVRPNGDVEEAVIL